MDRTDETLNLAGAPWLADPAAQAVCAAIAAGGHVIYFVGGCVRNALLGEPVRDIDLATDALPEEVSALAVAAGLKPVPTGIDHGTITVVASGVAFEVTTFRRDVDTDGRRAVVAFSESIAEDALRRDFTINALYATASGDVVDPLGGLSDIRSRRIRFIEDADARIREDYLRILRFFRFHAWYGVNDGTFDTDALSAIASNTDGLETLSAERIGAEMLKLLGAPNPAPAVATMRQTGVLAIVLPGSDDRMLAPVVHLELLIGLKPDALLRLACIGGDTMAERLRLSKARAREVALIREQAFDGPSLPEIAYRHGAEIAQKVLVLRCALAERPPEEEQIALIHASAGQEFPISAKDLTPRYQGKALGARLSQLEAAWIASDFTLDAKSLLALPDD